MTNLMITRPAAPAGRRNPDQRVSDWIGRTQAELSDYVHASEDELARFLGWGIAAGTGQFGFGDRTYHDPRLTTRRKTMVRRGTRRPVVRRPLRELAIPRGRVNAGEHPQ
jgi:hypothetical protein